MIVKNRLITHLQKIRFSSIIKKLEFWHKNLWKKQYAERHLTCTDMFLWSFFRIFYLRWLDCLVSYEVRGTVGARVKWMLIATYFFNNHMYYSNIWVEGWEMAEMSPEKSDNKKLLVSPRGDFYILYLFHNFLLIEVVNPSFL